jgi:plastocyanin
MTISTAPRRRLPRLSRLARLGFAVAALTVLTALGSGVAIAADRSIEMRDFAFSPRTVEIRVGDRVTWTNRDGVEHNATNGSFDTGLLAEGESASIRFTAPGTYEFFCTPHPSMTGTVIVRSTAAPPTDTLGAAAAAPDGPDVRLGALLGLIGLGLLATASLRARRDRSRDERPGA